MKGSNQRREMTEPVTAPAIRFTVVIPLHNKAPHVLRAVQSALSQAYPPYEVIVINDASSDEGPDLVSSVHDKRIQILSREVPGAGGYAARNAGIAAARGDWVAFLDADDAWEIDHLEQIAALVRPDIGCVFTAHRIEPMGIVYPNETQSAMLLGSALAADDIIAAWLLSSRCPLWTGGVVVRRDVLAEVGPFRENGITRGGDKDMWLRIITATKSRFSPVPTAMFYQDTINRVSNKAAHALLPAITVTIDSLMRGSDVNPKLLQKLKSQEIGLYIRYRLGKRRPVPLNFLRALRWSEPSDWRHMVLFAASLPFHFRSES